MRFVSVFVTILSFYTAPLSLLATTYYLSPGGNDSNSGTSSNLAWKTTSKVNATTFHPGDKILFQGGSTFTGYMNFDASDKGSPTNAVLIGSYGTGRATIYAGYGNALYAYNCSGMIVENLNIKGAGSTTNSSSGIYFYMDLTNGVKLPYLRLRNLDVSGFGKEGISIGSWHSSKCGYTNVLVQSVTSHDNKLTGMSTFGYSSAASTKFSHQDVNVISSKFYNNSGDPKKTDNHSGSGLILGDVDRGKIENCLAYNNGWLCNFPSAGPVGLWAYDCNHITIQYNESHHNRTGTGSKDGGGFDLDGGVINSVMQYNYSHENDGAGYLLCQYSGARVFSNNVVRYNISQNDGRQHGYGGIYVSGGSKFGNSHCYQNTLFMAPATNSSPCSIGVSGSMTNITFRNNILVSTGGVYLVKCNPSTGATFQGNDYYSSGGSFRIYWAGTNFTSLAAWQSSKGQEKLNGSPVGKNVNPLLTAPGKGPTFNDTTKLKTLTAYQIASNSPMVNASLDIKSLFNLSLGTNDFYHRPVPLGGVADIGAHEVR